MAENPNPATSPATTLGRLWGPLVQVSLWITGIVGVFIARPARVSLAPSAPSDSALFAQFLVAVLSGVMFVAFAKYNAKRYLRAWVFGATVTAIFSAGMYFYYSSLQDEWTCPYATKWLLVRGETYTAATTDWIAAHYPGVVSCERLLQDAGVTSENVWLKDEVNHRHLVLNIVFTVLWLGCAASIMCAAHLLSLTAPPKPPRSAHARGST